MAERCSRGRRHRKYTFVREAEDTKGPADVATVKVMGQIYRLLRDADRTFKQSPNYDHTFMETCYMAQARLIGKPS
jgi:hypothetical protein